MSDLFSAPDVLVQGITGHHGSFHTEQMIAAGTRIIAGVTPKKQGDKVHGVPVYNTVADAVSHHPTITASVLFVPARFAKQAMIDALEAGIQLLVCITEGIPVHDMLSCYQLAAKKSARIIGPNCPGFIVPGSHKLGIIANSITLPGDTAIISRSGTLTYEAAATLSNHAIGQRIILGIGGDPIQGMSFREALEICQNDSATRQIVMIGEIGGQSEQAAADYIAQSVTKPVFGMIAGHAAPPGQTFGHAGAIVSGGGDDAASKTAYLGERGVIMSTTLDELLRAIIANR